MNTFMTGNEAVALGAYEAGVQYAAAYPGTPSTEILESISTYPDVIAEWAPNEKVALESAIGFSIAGGRAFASMKQVGLNVAADPLFSLAYTGCNGGLIVVTADEPGIHSSQTEQDNRCYAKMAKIPMLEPSDSAEAKRMVLLGMELSEQYKTPVLLRLTTRICHSKSRVETGARREPAPRGYRKDIWQYTTMPAVSQRLRVKLVEKLKELRRESEDSPLNFEEWNTGEVGVITSGISYQYAKDTFGDRASYLKLGFTYPLPLDRIAAFAKKVKKLIVIEETEPYIEEQVRAAGIACTGKDVLPEVGELSVPLLKKLLLGELPPEPASVDVDIVPRPPLLCAGCPHRGAFYALSQRKNLMVTGDIGCYGLGAMPPLNAMDTVLCMGASISCGHGAAKALQLYDPDKRVVCVIGDSTFFHSGMTGLLDVVYNRGNAVTLILDNRTTGMTGHQNHPGTGYSAKDEPAPAADLAEIVRALGVQNVRQVNPLRLDEISGALDWALGLGEPSVIIARWPCVLKRMTPADRSEFALEVQPYVVDESACIGCKKCIASGCPALVYDAEGRKASIDRLTCAGCTLCAQICPADAIRVAQPEKEAVR